MNQEKAERIAYVIAALVLAAGAVLFGLSLLPARSAAAERGVLVPWLLTWVMIWLTSASGVAVAGYLIATTGGKDR